MSKRAYLVSEIVFNENFAGYLEPTDGCVPDKIFLNESESEEYLEAKELETFKNLVLDDLIIGHYNGSYIDQSFQLTEDFIIFLKNKILIDGSEYDNDWLPDMEKLNNLSEEDWKTFNSYCLVSWCKIDTVEFGGIFS